MTKAKSGGHSETIIRKTCISPGELHEAKLMPISLNGIYEACNNGEIECFRIGKKIVIPTAPLRRKLGMEAA